MFTGHCERYVNRMGLQGKGVDTCISASIHSHAPLSFQLRCSKTKSFKNFDMAVAEPSMPGVLSE